MPRRSSTKQSQQILIKIASAIVIVIVVVGLFCLLAMLMPGSSSSYDASKSSAQKTAAATTTTQKAAAVSMSLATSTEPQLPAVTHIPTPAAVKAVYISSWVAGTPSISKKVYSLIDSTELNAIVIDVKDSTGRISFTVSDPTLVATGAVEKRIPDIKSLIADLHARGIYVIARIATFEDPYYVKIHPEDAVKTKEGGVWKNTGGTAWLDVGAKPVWDYVTALGKEAYADGFDEINFDYIRFPSDGNMSDIAYPFSEGKAKPEALNEFFTFIDNQFRPLNIPISMDIFGETTTSNSDLGIGQVIENALAHFDYVAPMVYPSHFADGFNGWKVPAAAPYPIVQYSMTRGEQRAIKLATATSTVTSKKVGTTTVVTVTPVTPPAHVGQLRPWLQDFSLGKTPYTPLMVRQQIQATYDSGLNSWMLWNAANKYDAAALLGPDDTLSTSTFFATTTASTNTYAAP